MGHVRLTTSTPVAVQSAEEPSPAAGKRAGRGARLMRQTFRALENENYRRFWIGQAIAMIGMWVQRVSQAWLVLRLTDSPFALGVAIACQTVPVLVLSLFGGVLADRLPKQRLLLVTRVIMLVQAALLAILTAGGWIQLIHVYLLAALWGVANAIDYPARQSFTKELVAAEDVPNAVALNSIVMNTARLGGPALAGLLIATIGVAACFALNAVSSLAVIVALLALRPDRFFEGHAPPRGGMLAQIGESFRYAARTPDLALVLFLAMIFGIFGYNFDIVLPLIARYVLDAGPIGFGALSSAMAVGSLVGALRIAHSGAASQRMVLLGAAGFGALLVCVAFADRWLLLVPALVLMGICSITYFTTATSRAQMIAPPELRGRVMSLYAFLDLGSAPVGSLLIGTLANRLGVQPAVTLFGTACLLGTLAGWLYIRSRQTPIRPGVREALPPA